MATVVNPLDNIITVLTANYTAQDTITPTFAKVYTKSKDKEPRPGEDFIYVYSQLTEIEPTGIGSSTIANVNESIKIDIRSRPDNTSQSNLFSDTHARKVLTEVQNVLINNFVNPDSNFNLISPFFEIVDLSNGSRGIFRYVLTINMIEYCRDLAA